MGRFDDPLITIKQQAPSGLVDTNGDLLVQAAETNGYNDFVVSSTEIFYVHPELVHCSSHTISAETLNGSFVELTITFFAGDNVELVETITDERKVFIVPGTTRIGFQTTSTNTTTTRSWSDY